MSTPVKQESGRAEKTGFVHFTPKDTALRNDVRALGAMVGELLLEQGGEALYKTVEAARRQAIAWREGDGNANGKLQTLLGDLSPNAARDVVRAFSTYFQVVNTAEQVHRIRRRREYLRDSDQRQPRSFDDTFARLQDAGFSPEALEKLLQQLVIQPVFTAHPTETTRRTILRKQQNIVRRMIDVQNPALTPQEYRACFDSIRADITAIWQTEESPGEGLTVFDELEHTLFFLTDVIYHVIPPFYEAIENALADVYEDAAAELQIPRLLSFGSLVGGDLSAGEEISARTIRATFARQRSLLLDRYFRDCQMLSEKLSQSTTRIDVDEAVNERIEKYARQFPETYGSVPHRYRSMPYRVLLRLITRRLKATYDESAFPYESPQQFIGDLNIIASSLATRRGSHAGMFAVNRLVRRAETFGFHFLSLDIRHNADDLQRVVGHCLGAADWMQQSREQRTARLRQALEINDSPAVEPHNDAKRLFSVFRSIIYCRRKYGESAVGALLVRHSRGIDDILAALLVASWSDLHNADGTVAIDVVPCFETGTELRLAAGLIRDLMEDRFYRRNLAARGEHQTVMLSISDASSDGNVVASRWNMQRAHVELATLFEAAGIDFTFYHGRGSLSGRGGVADGIAHGHLRATEHGEAVNERYGVRGIAVRTLEKAFSAVTLATAGLTVNDAADAQWPATVDRMAAAADAHYGKLADADFEAYFRMATPIDVIQHMRSGSAPSSDRDAEHFRLNMPWAFAWAQARFLLPGWYGFGSGLQACLDAGDTVVLRTMLAQWPFFRRLVTDVEVALAIADPGIAAHYSALAGADLHQRYFPVIQEEYDRSINALLTLTEQQELLANNNTLRRSIRLRNPYVDPMSLLQVSLLRRWRDGGSADNNLLTALRASVNGISHGLQTTG